jgi:HK97 family phage prohead protease
MKIEQKNFNILTPFAVKSLGADVEDKTGEGILHISGYANWCGKDEYGKTYADLAGDVVIPHGMNTDVWAANPQIFLGHDRDKTIGKGIRLEKRDDGLFLEAEIHADAMDPKDFYRVKSGLLSMFSIGFRTLDGEWKEVDGREVWYITKALLLEVSVVSIPANSKSSFSVMKSLDGGAGIYTEAPEPSSSKEDEQPTIREAITMRVKIKQSDLLAADALEQFKQEGGNPEEEVELSLIELVQKLAAKELAGVAGLGERLTAIEAKFTAEAQAQAEATEAAAKAQADAEMAEELTKMQEMINEIKALQVD